MTQRTPRTCVLPAFGPIFQLHPQADPQETVLRENSPYLPSAASPAAEPRAGDRSQRACAAWCGSNDPTLPPAGQEEGRQASRQGQHLEGAEGSHQWTLSTHYVTMYQIWCQGLEINEGADALKGQ